MLIRLLIKICLFIFTFYQTKKETNFRENLRIHDTNKASVFQRKVLFNFFFCKISLSAISIQDEIHIFVGPSIGKS